MIGNLWNRLGWRKRELSRSDQIENFKEVVKTLEKIFNLKITCTADKIVLRDLNERKYKVYDWD